MKAQPKQEYQPQSLLQEIPKSPKRRNKFKMEEQQDRHQTDKVQTSRKYSQMGRSRPRDNSIYRLEKQPNRNDNGSDEFQIQVKMEGKKTKIL